MESYTDKATAFLLAWDQLGLVAIFLPQVVTIMAEGAVYIYMRIYLYICIFIYTHYSILYTNLFTICISIFYTFYNCVSIQIHPVKSQNDAHPHGSTTLKGKSCNAFNTRGVSVLIS